MSKNIGIDLGTANIVVHVKGQGIVLREPSVIAVEKTSKKIMAIGIEAQQMVGRTPGNIIAVRPMKDGVIADFNMAQALLSSFLKRVQSKSKFRKPRILIGVPCGITEVEKRAVMDATRFAGAKETKLIEEPIAAAVGENIEFDEPTGQMVVDIGGGTTEVAVLSTGGIVECQSIRLAGDGFDEAIMAYIRKNHQLLIGERMAEKIKIEIGSAFPFPTEKELNVTGRDLVTGLPKTFTIYSSEIRDALTEGLYTIIEAIRVTLEKTPPELSADIMDQGILLTGGGSLLHGLDQLINQETNIKVNRAVDPLSCVALGTAKLLDRL